MPHAIALFEYTTIGKCIELRLIKPMTIIVRNEYYVTQETQLYHAPNRDYTGRTNVGTIT